MKELEILKHPSASFDVACDEIIEVTNEVRELSQDMIVTMVQNHCSILTAPQVGVNKQIVTVLTSSGSAVTMINPNITHGHIYQNTIPLTNISFPTHKFYDSRWAKIVVEYYDLNMILKRQDLYNIQAVELQFALDLLEGQLNCPNILL